MWKSKGSLVPMAGFFSMVWMEALTNKFALRHGGFQLPAFSSSSASTRTYAWRPGAVACAIDQGMLVSGAS